MNIRFTLSRLFVGVLMSVYAVMPPAWADSNHEAHGHAENAADNHLGPLHVMGAWVRPTVKGQKATGAYMKIMAHADGKLVGATSDLAERTEVHEMKMDGDIMRMRRVESLPVKEGDMIDLEPGGYHVMLMGLKGPIEKDSEIHFNLVFESRDGKQTEVPVKAKATMSGGQGHDHDHDHGSMHKH